MECRTAASAPAHAFCQAIKGKINHRCRVQESFSQFNGFVANFAQEVLKGQLPLSRRGLSGQGVELFGHREALLDPVFQLLFSQHVPQFDANESGLRRIKRFEP